MWRGLHQLLLGLAACGRLGFDPIGGGTDGATVTNDGVAAQCSGVATCPSHDLQLGPGDMINDLGAASADGNLAGSCGGNPGFEATWQVHIERSGQYVFRLTAAVANVLYVRDVCCTGPELGCSVTLLPIVTLHLDANQVVIVVVDGAMSGEYVNLHAEGAM